MKKFLVSNGGQVCFDTETLDVSAPNSAREGISNIYLIEEPMTIVVDRYGKKYELNAKKDDILIKFYESEFEFPVVLVKSKDWTNNIKSFNKLMDKRRKELEAKRSASKEIANDVPNCTAECYDAA